MTSVKNNENKLRIAAIGDLHVKETSNGAFQKLFEEISNKADVILLCGDLTDLGLTTEAEVLGAELKHCSIPIIGVLGNHDYHNRKEHEVSQILQNNKLNFVHGTEYIFEKNGKKYGFTGAKGFGGGFRPSIWGRFGEPEQKAFYDAVSKEVQTLELGLNRLQRMPDIERIIVLLHFSPIRETLHGELQELYPFLGSTRIEEVIDRYEVDSVFHGHSHFGYPKGRTEKGIQVYNCAYPLMQKTSPEKPYTLVEL